MDFLHCKQLAFSLNSSVLDSTTRLWATKGVQRKSKGTGLRFLFLPLCKASRASRKAYSQDRQFQESMVAKESTVQPYSALAPMDKKGELRRKRAN